MRLIQYLTEGGERAVAAIVDEAAPRRVTGATTTRILALVAHRTGRTLAQAVLDRGLGDVVDYDALVDERRLLVPLDHPEPGRMTLSLTGLTHLGSARQRDAMHAKLDAANLTDSMKMFRLGLDGGKPAVGQAGVQPEWAYKGDGSWAVAPGCQLERPAFALDAGEEGEIAGLYVIGDRGEVLRLGFALANEFSDHVMERQNYLYLAHSKLRVSSFGPELRLGALPPAVTGRIAVLRDGAAAWQGELLSGEENMCHSIENLERHHFKYARFRRPGDAHVHYFGASALSCTGGFVIADGDVVEVSAEGFGRALRNPIAVERKARASTIVAL